MASPLQPPSASRAIPRRNAVAILLIGLGLSALVGLAGLWKSGPVARLDDALLDVLERVCLTDKPARDTVVIDIDDVSLSAVGQWPWPRYRMAALIQQVAAARPGAIALDILFPESDRSSLVNIQQTFKHDFGVDVAFTGVPAGLLDNDGFLGEVMAHDDVVGSSYFYFDHVNKSAVPARAGISIAGRTDLLALNDAPGVLVNADAIASRTRTTGFVNELDDDGVLRRLPLLIRHGGRIYPNLSLAGVMHKLGVSSGTVAVDDDGLSLHVGTHRIPIDAAGYATLRFSGRSARYAAISAVDVLNGNVPPEALRDKVVFIGTSAAGLNDFHNTSVEGHFPGLKLQSVMAQDILDDTAVRTPWWANWAVVSACLVAGALMSGMFVLGSAILPFVVGALLIGLGSVAASVACFTQAGWFVSASAPLLVVALLFVTLSMTRFAIERRRAAAWLRQLENARQITIESMASVAETRDPETGAHIKRTQNYVRAIAHRLKATGHYPDILTREFIQLLFISAPLHDIGKVGVPDHILLKPGRLTVGEMEVMKQHAEFGRRIIFSTSQRIDGDNFLVIAGEIAATHHEKWDGTGYPVGLAGQAIPLSGRIMAVADIYDALISRRCYKEPFTHEHSTALMREMRGKTFDPVVIDAFFEIEDEIKAIAFQFKDEEDHSKMAVAAVETVSGATIPPMTSVASPPVARVALAE